ncbi:MAG TPA: enoyl-CoA hydratase [Stellaceae bacterium]|jgi:enoyl-CoA hydratase/carnithine racemase
MDGTTASLVLRQDEGGVATLTLNRPEARNALSVAMMNAVQDQLDAIAKDKGVKVVVLAGAGPGFCAGHDLREMRANPGKQYYEAVFAQCSRMMMSIVNLPQPVIARIHGIATAAGCQLVATCDLAVASAEAKFATSGINVGLFCSTPAVAVSRAVGRKPAMEMLLTGDFIPADEALRIGLVNRVVPAADLDAAVGALAKRVTRHLPLAIGIGKASFNRQIDMNLADAYRDAGEAMVRNMLTSETEAGIDAFLAKRPPPWQEK